MIDVVESVINTCIYTLIYLHPALKPMASTGKSFGLKLYIHSMTDNIIKSSLMHRAGRQTLVCFVFFMY
jgi:hypothetical protein